MYVNAYSCFNNLSIFKRLPVWRLKHFNKCCILSCCALVLHMSNFRSNTQCWRITIRRTVLYNKLENVSRNNTTCAKNTKTFRPVLPIPITNVFFLYMLKHIYYFLWKEKTLTFPMSSLCRKYTVQDSDTGSCGGGGGGNLTTTRSGQCQMSRELPV